MSVKVKTAFIITITLVLGLVIGAMLNRALLHNRIRRTFQMQNPSRFVADYEKIISPDAAQATAIREILEKHAKRVSEVRADFLEETQSANESMREELDQILTPEQKMRLERGFLGRPSFRDRRPMRININKELATLKKELGLSEDQTAQVKRILERRINQGGMAGRERGPMGFMRQFMQREEEEIEKILTEEQKIIYEQIKKNRRNKLGEKMQERRKIIEERDFPRF